MRPACERCDAVLSADAPGACICSFECTFCSMCVEVLSNVCPNCGGELTDRPTRAKQMHERHPPSTERRYKGG